MTQPSFIFFGPDGRGFGGTPKIAMCSHLYRTSDRGRVVEGLYARLSANGVSTDFDVWVYGSDGLARGSGVYVGRDGVTCTHHFLLADSDQTFDFVAGRYAVEFFGKVVGDSRQIRLFSLGLDLTDEVALAIGHGFAGAFFDWRPAKCCYEARVDTAQEQLERSLQAMPPGVFKELMGNAQDLPRAG